MSILHELGIYAGEIEAGEELCSSIADAFDMDYNSIKDYALDIIRQENSFEDLTNRINEELMDSVKHGILQKLEENDIPAEAVCIQHNANGSCLCFLINNENIDSGYDARCAVNKAAFEYRANDEEVLPVIGKCESLLLETGYEEETALKWLEESVYEQIENEFDFWEYTILDLSSIYMQQTIEMVKERLEETKSDIPQLTHDDSFLSFLS